MMTGSFCRVVAMEQLSVSFPCLGKPRLTFHHCIWDALESNLLCGRRTQTLEDEVDVDCAGRCDASGLVLLVAREYNADGKIDDAYSRSG